MRYEDKNYGFSFELPDEWQIMEHIIPLTFASDSGDIQIQIGVLPKRYTNPVSREDYFKEPGSTTLQGKTLGGETNTVVIQNRNEGCISSIHDNTHYVITYNNADNSVVQEAIKQLLVSFQFPSIEKAPQPLDRKRGENPNTTFPDEINKLLIELDTKSQDSLVEVEREILKFGDKAVDALLSSVDDCKRKITATAVDTDEYMNSLEKRIKLLGKIKNPEGTQAILNALCYSAKTIAFIKQQINDLDDHPDPFYRYNSRFLIEGRKIIAESLYKASISALADIGNQALPEIRKRLVESSPPIRKALKKALRKIEKKWWQFWKR